MCALHRIPRVALRVFLAVLLTSLTPHAMMAQLAESLGRVPVVVAIVDSLPPDQFPAVILRKHSGSQGRDVILLDRRRANGRLLAAGVFQLLVSRNVDGEEAEKSHSLRVSPNAVPAAWTYKERLQAAHVVNRLRVKPDRELPGIGRARTTTITLPRGALQGKVQGSRRG